MSQVVERTALSMLAYLAMAQEPGLSSWVSTKHSLILKFVAPESDRGATRSQVRRVRAEVANPALDLLITGGLVEIKKDPDEELECVYLTPDGWHFVYESQKLLVARQNPLESKNDTE